MLQRHLDRIASGELTPGPTHVYPLDAIRAAHEDLEHGRRIGKLVVRTG
ncbi:zinc-binding dehydrogenase [Kitasatospora indigofera]